MSKAQKAVMKDLMNEMDKEVELIESYKARMEEAFMCGLLKKAKKMIGQEDPSIQRKIKEAKESIRMIEVEIDHGKQRLNSYK